MSLGFGLLFNGGLVNESLDYEAKIIRKRRKNKIDGDEKIYGKGINNVCIVRKTIPKH